MNFLSHRSSQGVPAVSPSFCSGKSSNIFLYIYTNVSDDDVGGHCDLIISYSRPARGALNCVAAQRCSRREAAAIKSLPRV